MLEIELIFYLVQDKKTSVKFSVLWSRKIEFYYKKVGEKLGNFVSD